RTTVSGSTAESKDQRIAGSLLYGSDGSTAKLGVRGVDGKLRDTTITRRTSHFQLQWTPVPEPHWKKLGNVGYVDLVQLTVPEVDKMFADLATTKAIVFDMRGYPK